MDHPCYKCGHNVEDGRPFCPECDAPQIRVPIPELAPVAAGVPSGDLYASDSAAAVIPSAFSPDIFWPVALRYCAIAALIGALIMSLGLMVPLLAVLGAGFLAVNFYHRKNPVWIVTSRSGAKLGAVCGILFFGMAAIFETIAVVAFHTGGQIRDKMLEALQQAATRSSDPQVQATLDWMKTSEGITVMLVFGLIVLFVVSIAAGSLAGALTGAMLGRKRRI
jgi:hypothetical protein